MSTELDTLKRLQLEALHSQLQVAEELARMARLHYEEAKRQSEA